MPDFDPSKLDPKLLMQLSQLIQQLPPDKLSRMQTLMHNMMAGFDVQKEMEEFEKSLPPGFREKLMSIMMTQATTPSAPPIVEVSPPSASPSDSPMNITDMNIKDARMTVLQAVADGKMTPAEADVLLFGS